MPDTIWVAVLRISRRTAEKLSGRHQLSADEVRDAIQCVDGLAFSWDEDQDKGLRAIVRVQIRGRWHFVVLYPAPDPLGDVWNLGSAYPDQ